MDIEAILKQLTLEEKAALVQGWSNWTTRAVPRLGIPSIFLSDGPHGLRKQEAKTDHLGINDSIPATCYPTAATMACSWDPELGQELGTALGREAAAHDINVVLGPGLNMKRSPLCGRNFEYFSEDPYLAGKMAAAYIRGIQSQGSAACPKHFAVNSQETLRLCVDEVVDERTLREIYLTGFEIAVREGQPKCVMSSYNKINGTYANENPQLLVDILRKEWGFGGFVMSDWGGDNIHAQAVQSGSALTMPYPGVDAAARLTQAVREGSVPESALDDRLRESLPVMLDTYQAVKAAPKTYDRQAHHALARKCAAGSIVLLENDGLLPLNPNVRAALIGAFAETPRYQGAGSSQVNPTRLDNLKDCLIASGLTLTGYAPGFRPESPDLDPDLLSQAVSLAQSAEAVILCVGLDDRSESEGFDRPNMDLPECQQALIRAVARVNPNIVLVLCGGSPFSLPQVHFRAVIHGYLGGQAGAAAMADALTGLVNPSGRLAETWPLSLADNPCVNYADGGPVALHREGLYIGYRYYDTAGIPVRWPFGHGLSYTSFRYQDLRADRNGVTFTLTNTGNRDGAETAQVYVSCRGGSVFRPRKELKGFRKVFLKAGESKTVTIPLDDKAFRYFNVKTGRFEIEEADYDIMVAASVSDVKLTATLHVAGTGAPTPYGNLPSYESGRIKDVSDEEFSALLGRSLPETRWPDRIHRNTPVCHLDRSKSPLLRWVHRFLSKKAESGDFMMVMTFSMPLRALEISAMKEITGEMVDDVIYMANGRSFLGLCRLIRDFFRGKKRAKAYLSRLENP